MEAQEKSCNDKLDAQNVETLGREKDIYESIDKVNKDVATVDQKI